MENITETFVDRLNAQGYEASQHFDSLSNQNYLAINNHCEGSVDQVPYRELPDRQYSKAMKQYHFRLNKKH